ncbi:uncharacterized protein METZ01_LOCUS485037, partial [marine metagenome]
NVGNLKTGQVVEEELVALDKDLRKAAMARRDLKAVTQMIGRWRALSRR